MAQKYNSTTTLNEIRAAKPCKSGWEKLLSGLGKTAADDEPLPLLNVLEINGISDALWCLDVPSLERLSRHFKAWCAEQVLHLFEADQPNDMRVRDQIAMLRNNKATPEMRDAASAAARAAQWDAVSAAASAAARDAASAAASAAARAAAWDAASDAAWDAQEKQLRLMISDVE